MGILKDHGRIPMTKEFYRHFNTLTLEKYFNFELNALWWSYAIAIHKM